jgi:hypothetical protein
METTRKVTTPRSSTLFLSRARRQHLLQGETGQIDGTASPLTTVVSKRLLAIGKLVHLAVFGRDGIGG